MIKKVHRKGVAPAPLHGLFQATIGGQPAVVEYEPDPDLRDTEQVPLLHEGGIDGFLRRERCPTPRMPGTSRTASRLAMKSALPATSTNPSPCARWRRYGLI